MEAERLNIETLKLLIQVAWADHEVAQREIDYIMTMAQQWGVSSEVTGSLERALRDDGRLPAPDIGFLRKYPEEVMRAVNEMIAIDDEIVEDEEAMAVQIRELLQG